MNFELKNWLKHCISGISRKTPKLSMTLSGGAWPSTGRNTGQPGCILMNSICSWRRNRQLPIPLKSGSVSGSGAGFPRALHRISRICCHRGRLRTYLRTAILSICSTRLPGTGRSWQSSSTSPRISFPMWPTPTPGRDYCFMGMWSSRLSTISPRTRSYTGCLLQGRRIWRREVAEMLLTDK